MSVKLVNEVWDHAPADWTQAERLFLAVLAEKAREGTRRAWPGQTTIARRTGLKGDSVTRLCHRLAAKGWELREQLGIDRKGRPVFAHNGQAAIYVIPKLCPLGSHDPDVCFPSKGRTVVRPLEEDAPAPEGATPAGESPSSDPSPDEGPGINEPRADGGPGLTDERADGGPAITSPALDQDPDGGPGFSAKGRTVVRESPDGGPPLTVIEPSKFNPQPVAAEPIEIPTQRTSTTATPRWLLNNTQTSPRVAPDNRTSTRRQSGLFAVADIKLTEREQIVFDWLRWHDYPEVTPGDAKALDKILRKELPGKGPGYLRGIAKPDGSGFGGWYQQYRHERAEVVDKEIRKLEKTEPPCVHGSLAGRSLHPTHGTFLCAACRAGVPVRDDGPTTHPIVVAALDAYQSAFGQTLITSELINLTQQAEALRVEGATAGQLTELAHAAAADGIGLIAAATRKDA